MSTGPSLLERLYRERQASLSAVPAPTPELHRTPSARRPHADRTFRPRKPPDLTPGYRRGEEHPNALLDPVKVGAIRIRYRAGETPREIAADYGVKPACIYKVLTGQSWRHVPDPLGPVVLRRDGPRPRGEGDAA